YDLGLIVIEATGKWHRQIHRSLHAGGYKVRVVNPLRARLFAEGMGLLGKTDRLDARMLAEFAESLGDAARPPAPELMEELQELVQARVSAVEEQTALTPAQKCRDRLLAPPARAATQAYRRGYQSHRDGVAQAREG